MTVVALALLLLPVKLTKLYFVRRAITKKATEKVRKFMAGGATEFEVSVKP